MEEKVVIGDYTNIWKSKQLQSGSSQLREEM